LAIVANAHGPETKSLDKAIRNYARSRTKEKFGPTKLRSLVTTRAKVYRKTVYNGITAGKWNLARAFSGTDRIRTFACYGFLGFVPVLWLERGPPIAGEAGQNAGTLAL